MTSRKPLDVGSTDLRVQRSRSITVDDLLTEAGNWPVPKRRALVTVSETLHNLSAALTTLDHSRYPGVQEAAFNVVEERTQGPIGQLT
jgi:hypothetical protein